MFRYDYSRRHRPVTGFTLIEVLLVVVILAVLVAMAQSQFGGVRDQANIDIAKSQIGLVEKQIDLYHMTLSNQYPDQLQDLWEEPADSELADKWAGPYLDPLKEDPWGNEYMYEKEGKNNPGKYDIWSKGPDGKSNTDDDIGNWEEKT